MSCGCDGSAGVEEALLHRCTWRAYLGQDEFGNNEYQDFPDVPCYIVSHNISFAPNDTEDRWRKGPSNGYQLLFGNPSEQLITGTVRSLQPNDICIVNGDEATVISIEATLSEQQIPLMLTVNATTEREV